MSKKIYNVSTARIAATARRDRNNNGGVTGSVSVSGMVYNDYNISEKADKADLLALSTLVDSMFEWVPDETLAEGGYIRAKANFASVGEITAMGAPGSGGTTPPTPTKVSDLQDVNVAGVANGMVLVYRNGYWVAETPQSGGIDTVQLASYLSQNNYVQQSALANYVTLDTTQTITGAKTFTSTVIAKEIQITGITSATGSWIKSDSAANIFLQASGKAMLVLNADDNAVRSALALGGTISLGTSATPWNNVYANKFIRNGGTSSQFLMADGSVRAISASGARFNSTPIITEGGVMEVGKYIDFHESSEDTSDYSGRLQVNGGVLQYNNNNILHSGNYSSIIDFINIKDIRDTTPKPTDFADKKVTSWFNNLDNPGTNYWYSGLTVRGWGSGYCTWQMAASATDAISDKNLYFRVGRADEWQSWQKVLTDGNYSSVLDNSYVKKSGDTMSGRLTINTDTSQLLSLQGHASGSYVQFGKGGVGAEVGWYDGLGAYLQNDALATTPTLCIDTNDINALKFRSSSIKYTIWHSGNDGSGSGLDADLLDGIEGSGYARTIINKAVDANDYASLNGLWGGKVFNATNMPYNYYAFLHFGNGQYYGQFNAVGNSLKFRAGNETISTPDWKTIAFTDSNVASATKLANTRTIWGQNFNGEGNVTGSLSYVTDITMSAGIVSGGQTNGVYVGCASGGLGAAYTGGLFWAYGNSPLYFYTNSALRMLIAADGTTCIGTTTPVAGAKLHVQGNIYAAGEVTATNTSDMRLKRNILPIQNAIDLLKALGGYYTFDYLPDAVEREHNGRIGLLYQNVGGHFGELMRLSRNDGYGALNYLKPDYINLIGAATLENADEIAVLKQRVAALEEELERRVRA